MEQKQLDDLEDSFFGEEFIEDFEDLPPVNPSKNQEIKIEPREEPAELRLRKAAKKMDSPIFKKSAVKKSEKMTVVKPSKETAAEEKALAAEKLSVAKSSRSARDKVTGVPNAATQHLPKGTELRENKEKKNLETPTKKETVTVNIKPAKEHTKVSETKPVVETSSPINPWEEDNKGPGLFKEASTWKAFTGVVLVLLVLSLFTQGFNFAEKDALTGGAVVTLAEAEQNVLQYVNTQLLQAPFQAEVQSAEELDTLYKVTLSVAGQMVDSYVTKDGKLFFPQGFDMGKNLLGDARLEENTPPTEVEEEVVPTKPELAPEVEEPQEAEELVAATTTVELGLNAKKWIFEPNVLRVKKGSKVVLTVVPSGLDFTFAIPSLGVEKKVTGTTEVVFTADKAGTFDFTCGSCEDWRGMRGNLVVESSK